MEILSSAMSFLQSTCPPKSDDMEAEEIEVIEDFEDIEDIEDFAFFLS